MLRPTADKEVPERRRSVLRRKYPSLVVTNKAVESKNTIPEPDIPAEPERAPPQESQTEPQPHQWLELQFEPAADNSKKQKKDKKTPKEKKKNPKKIKLDKQGNPIPDYYTRRHAGGTKLGRPLNHCLNWAGIETFWPMKLIEECDKAARILETFASQEYGDQWTVPWERDRNWKWKSGIPNRMSNIHAVHINPGVLKPEMLESCSGLAIFSVFHFSGGLGLAVGSGVVVVRLPSGEWSPPSAFVMKSVSFLGGGGWQFSEGIYVLNTQEAAKSFMRNGRFAQGFGFNMTFWLWGMGVWYEMFNSKAFNMEPINRFTHNRGFFFGAGALDTTVTLARPAANAAFYGKKGITVPEILEGKVPKEGPPGQWPVGAQKLMDALDKYAPNRMELIMASRRESALSHLRERSRRHSTVGDGNVARHVTFEDEQDA
ncbi:hypothetical protein OQA88_4409 [Cercophora sp. LCS_1]